MANPTYTLIQSVTLTTNTATVTLGSGGTIPQSYTDLKLVISARNTDTGGGAIVFTLNSDSISTNYNLVRLLNSNGSPGSGSGATNTIYWIDSNDWTSNTFGSMELYFPNYTSSNKKSVSVDAIAENNSSSAYLQAFTGLLWNGTGAITSIGLTSAGSTNFVTNSTFYLYGIKNS